jgi:putative membrane protein
MVKSPSTGSTTRRIAPFTEADLEAVRSAVREAEAGTSGEIVPFVVPASDPYVSALWKGAAFGALCGPLLALAAFLFGGGFWGVWGWRGAVSLWMVLPAAAGAAAGYLLAMSVPAVKRWLAGPAMLEARVRQRAGLAFLAEEVFTTRERTGILLFVSLFEHRVVVLGDSGINRQVEAVHWEGVVATVVEGIRAGRPGAGLAAGIRQCGELLARFGVAIRPDDSNELADDLRRGDV